MFKNLMGRLAAGLVAAMLTGAAASIALVAAAFGLYAGLRLVLTAPAAAGLTALAFAVLAGLIILVAPKLAPRRRAKPPRPGDRAPRGETWAGVAEVALAALLAVAGRVGKRRPAPRKPDRKVKEAKAR